MLASIEAGNGADTRGLYGQAGKVQSANPATARLNHVITPDIEETPTYVRATVTRNLAIAINVREIHGCLRATGFRSREIAADSQENGIYSRAIGIYWSEVATYTSEIGANILEMTVNSQEISASRSENIPNHLEMTNLRIKQYFPRKMREADIGGFSQGLYQSISCRATTRRYSPPISPRAFIGDWDIKPINTQS